MVIALSVPGMAQQNAPFWQYSYAPPLPDDDAIGTAVTVDGAGNVYTAGTEFQGIQAVPQAFVAKYSWIAGALVEVWNRKLPVDTNQEVPVAIHKSGDTLFVAGNLSDSLGTPKDCFIQRISSATGFLIGTPRLLQTFSGTTPAMDVMTAMDADADHLYIVGEGKRNGGIAASSAALWKLKKSDLTDATGWTNPWLWDLEPQWQHSANDVAVDTDGTIYLAGEMSEDLEDDQGDADIVMLKVAGGYLPNPHQVRRFGSVNNEDKAYGIDIDDSHLYVTGYSFGPGVSKEAITFRMSKNLWIDIQGPFYYGTQFDEIAKDIKVHSDGSFTITGYSTNGPGNSQLLFTRKYLANGTDAWTHVHGNGVLGIAQPTMLSLDADGNAYVVGRIQATGTNSDLLAYKLKGTSGRVKWMHQFHRGANDLGSAIAVDSCRNVAVAGTTQTAKFFAETIKYGADVVPHSYTVHRGYVLGGTVDDVEYDDDSNLRIEQAQYTGNPYDRVRVYFDGTSPCTDPNQIRFELDYTFKELTAHSATVEIWFYNYSTGLWEGMAQVPAPASGDRVIVTVDSNPGRFVSGGPLKVYANWSAFGTTGNMIVDIDQVVWFVQR